MKNNSPFEKDDYGIVSIVFAVISTVIELTGLTTLSVFHVFDIFIMVASVVFAGVWFILQDAE